MEIKNISGIMGTYQKVAVDGRKKEVARSADKSVDKIEFNFARSVEAAKADVAARLQEDISSEKTAEIAREIAEGKYDVSADNIAEAILMF